MAKLSAEEQKALEELQRKAEAPDEPDNSKQTVTNVTIDLSNPDAVKNARRFGFLPAFSDDDPDPDKAAEGDDDEDDDDDAGGGRGGFFGGK